MGFSSLVPDLSVLEISPVELLTASFGGAPRSEGAGMSLVSCAAALETRSATNMTESSVRINLNLPFNQQVGRIFNVFLHLHQELHRLSAIDNPMIIRQRQIHHWPDRRLPVDWHDPVLNLVEAENGYLRRIEDRRAEQ